MGKKPRMFGKSVTESGNLDNKGYTPRQRENARQFKKAMKDAAAQKLRESQPPSRTRTVRGFILSQTKEGGSWQNGKYRGGRWRYSGHGETGLRVRQLRGQGHGRALDKALR